MRRLGAAVAGLAVVALIVAALLATADSSGPRRDRVAAVFDSVVGLVTGQDVAVAGVPVGSVESIELTEDDRARVTMQVDPAFARFYADASCTLANKFLLGERFVICDPGRPGAGRLAAREGVPTVPLGQTSAPVEADLVLSFATLPYRQRLELLLNELGIAAAGRGEDLNAVIRRAAPALRDTRELLRVVASQRRALGSAISSTDRVLASLARRPDRLTGFVEQAAKVSGRFASRRGELERSVRDLPGLLRQARPALADLDAFAVNATPLARSLRRSAPSVRRLFVELEPFSARALPAVRSLDAVAPVGRRALRAARPAIRELVPVAAQLRSSAPLTDTLTESLERASGPEGLMRFIFYATRAVARFDSTGHISPAHGALSSCSIHNTDAPLPGCAALLGGFARAVARPERRRRPSRDRHEPQVLPGVIPVPAPAPGAPPPLAPGEQPKQPQPKPQQPDLPDVVPELPQLPGLPPPSGKPKGGGGVDNLLDFLLGP